MLANYHTHTKRCHHARGEDCEYVEAAIQAGYKVLGFSDHCPWVYQDGFVSTIRMLDSEAEEYFSSLECLREEYKKDIQILIGFEAEYIPSLMEAQDAFLRDFPLDYMILGQHYVGEESFENYAGNVTSSEEKLCGYVDLCIEGMRSGRYRYLAHPDLINYDTHTIQYEREMRRLCEAMKEMDAILEMNILGMATARNYPNRKFWQIAKEVGNRVIIGMDAHAPQDLANDKTVKRAKRLCEGMEMVERLDIVVNK